MKIFDPESLKKWDEYTIQHEPVSPVGLMYRASKQLFSEIIQLVPSDKNIIILCGTGNNGGDGLCLASLLRDAFYTVEIWYCPVSLPTEENLYYAKKVKETEEISFREINPLKSRPEVKKDAVFIDALMGYSFRGHWKNGWEQFVDFINALPNIKIAVDLPSGLSDINIADNHCIRADYTLTIQSPKRCFFYENNIESIGKWKIVSIRLHEEYYKKTPTRYYMLDTKTVSSLIRVRKKSAQKWSFGHAALIVGHQNMPGAALLSCKACVRAGAGLTTGFIPKAIFTPAAAHTPEAMFMFTGESGWENEINLPPMVNALGVGPGLGQAPRTASLLMSLLSEKSHIPKVLDADALNMLAPTGDDKFRYFTNAILTPHTKEFRRLFGETENMEAMENLALDMAVQHDIVIILKGAHTRICCPDGTLYYNTTGNPGMAKGGSGDVLTGILTGLLAQGYTRKEAALIGVFLHGLAGDLAAEIQGEHSIVASDIIDQTGPSFLKLYANEQ